ncbi:MAG: lipopolysaccharide core heptose(I) kinase RfaP [Pseudomonadota bacterium]
MTEYYIGESARTAGIPTDGGAQAVLRWAHREALSASKVAIYRAREGRTTLRFESSGRAFFLKLHRGIGWWEIAKNLLRLRPPVLGASVEYRALDRLQKSDLLSLQVVAYASSGFNPARRQSALVTDALTNTVSLEDVCRNWYRAPPTNREKHAIIRALALTVRRMHDLGLMHRDCYLCHFHLHKDSVREREPRLSIIDLHRARYRPRIPLRWRVKDLSALHFSALECGLGGRDSKLFVRHYVRGNQCNALNGLRFWRRVEQRGLQLYRKHGGAEVTQTATTALETSLRNADR